MNGVNISKNPLNVTSIQTDIILIPPVLNAVRIMQEDGIVIYTDNISNLEEGDYIYCDTGQQLCIRNKATPKDKVKERFKIL